VIINKSVIPAQAGIHLSTRKPLRIAPERRGKLRCGVSRSTMDPGLRRDDR
jgi:hypothetical protein